MRYRLNTQNIKKLLLMMAALPVISLGVAFFTLAGFGTDPFTCMNMGLAQLARQSFGMTQLVVNCLLFALVWLFARYLVGIGTIANMVLIGFYVDWALIPLRLWLPEQLSMPARVTLMLCGVMVVSLGASIYTKSKLGVSPYDATGFTLVQKTGWNFAWCRIITDAAVTAMGFLLGSTVGAGTIITVFFMGPLITFFNRQVCDRLLHMDEFEDAIVTNPLVQELPDLEQAPAMELLPATELAEVEQAAV